jgi:hypothetical protein
MKLVVLFFAALMLVASTACRDDDEDVLADACTELGELQQDVAELEMLGPNSTVEQVKDAIEQVRDQARDAAGAVRRVQDARFEELRDARNDLNDALDDVDDDETVAQALQQVQTQIQEVLAARTNLVSRLGCR